MARQIQPTIFALAAIVALVASTACLGAEPKRKFVPVPLPLLPTDQVWIATLAAPPSAGGAMDDERVYIPVQTKQVQALSRANGASVWTRDIECVWPPVLLNGVLYAAGTDEINALDAKSGVPLWRLAGEQRLIAPLASANDLLIGVFDKGVVRAFAARDGQPAWTQEVGAASHSTPVSDGMRLFLALEDGRVVALKLIDGTRDWEKALEGTLNQPSVARDRLFVGTNDNFLYAFDSNDGRLAWKWKAGGDVVGVSSDRKGSAFYASLDNVLRAVNRSNGNQRWIKEIPTRPAAPPQHFSGGIAYKEIVVLTGATSEIDAFAADTGAAAGTYKPPADIIAGPLIDPALKPYEVAMVVITRDGRAVGLRPSAMALPEPMNVPFATELPGRRLERERLTAARPSTP